MGLISIRGGLSWPDRYSEANNNSSRLLDASGEKFAAMITIPKSGTLGKVRFRTGTVTTGDTLRVSFQDLNSANGEPDGTQDQYRDIVIANTDDNAWLLTGLITSDGTDTGSKRSVTRGDRIWVVFEYPSYSAGNLNLIDTSPAAHVVPMNQHYTAHQTGGVWSKLQTMGCFELIYDDNSLEPTPGAIPLWNTTLTAINNTSGTREQGNIFQVPCQMKVGGAFCTWDLDGDADVILYDEDGTTVLASASFDKDDRQATSVGPAVAVFSAEVTLEPGVWYRIVVKPTTSTLVTGRENTVHALGSFDAVAGGQLCYYTEKSSGGLWTDATARRAKIWLWVTAIHDGAGSAGTPAFASFG